MSDYELIHLKGHKCSGRAVRFVPLDPDERDNVLLLAAKDVGSDGTYPELKRTEWKLGVHQMIKFVSTEPVTDPNASDIKWRKVTPAVLEESYKELFTAKDHALLMATFRMYHEVSDEEINAIVGKVVTVASGD